MSASVSNYLFAMDERQRALRSTLSNNNQVENGVGVPANSSARKCLFGVPDQVELQRKYDELHEEERKRGMLKWGFDFDTETPLENSRYQWERVPSTSSVPKAYELSHLGPSERPGREIETISDVQEEETDQISVPPQPTSSSISTASVTQTLITDRFKIKRRPISSAATGKHNNESSSSGSAEKRQCISSSNPSSREGSP